MSSTNLDVVNSWKLGRRLSSAHMSTDGQNLYSYQLKIGETRGKVKVVILYEAPRNFYSKTTSAHVHLAAQVCDMLAWPNQPHPLVALMEEQLGR